MYTYIYIYIHIYTYMSDVYRYWIYLSNIWVLNHLALEFLYATGPSKLLPMPEDHLEELTATWRTCVAENGIPSGKLT